MEVEWPVEAVLELLQRVASSQVATTRVYMNQMHHHLCGALGHNKQIARFPAAVTLSVIGGATLDQEESHGECNDSAGCLPSAHA